ncbi:MAG: tyrosine-type recombinase/integrase [Nitrospiraceae bacterium]|nr:tyrosine-type recombinase/integrase [Nitrospiraceae bacterium]
MRMMHEHGDEKDKIIEELQKALTLAEQVADMERETAEIERDTAEKREKLQHLRDATARLKALETVNDRIEAIQGKAEGLVSRVEGIGRVVTQQKAAGKLAGEPLAALQNLLQSAGVVMRDRPAPTILTFLEETYIPDKNLAEDNRRHMEGYVRLFAKVLGDKPMNKVIREDIVKWVRALEKVRTSYGKGGRDHAKSIETIIKESKGKPTLSETTINKHITHVKQVFSTALRHHRFATSDEIDDMFSDIPLSDSVPKAQKRVNWPLAKLNALFQSPIWTGTQSAEDDRSKRWQSGKFIYVDAYWWLPVVALHTGARLEELAQLQHSDLKTDDDGLPYLDITDLEERRVKTLTSIRMVPVHPFLLELGFRELFIPGKKGRVFSELKQAGRPLKWGGQYSEDFTEYRRAVNLYKNLMDFHAFRHSFVSAMRSFAKVDSELVGKLVGHVHDPEAGKVGTTTSYTHFSIAANAEELAKLDWEKHGLNLSHLRSTISKLGGPRGRVVINENA